MWKTGFKKPFQTLMFYMENLQNFFKNSCFSQKGVKSFSRSVKLIEPVQNRHKKEIMQGPFS